MPDISTTERLRELFRKSPVLSMPELERAITKRSRRSLFRDLAALGYLSSYTHTGRYYTMRSVPNFDPDGLWHCQGIGFSRDGTLKATVRRLVGTAEAGHTHDELRLRLGVRVHNPLLELVEDREIRRRTMQGQFVYVAAELQRARVQLSRRRALRAQGRPAQAPTVGPALEIQVLVEVIHGSEVLMAPKEVAARLGARGVAATAAQVEEVFRRHGFEKKTAPSPSRRSRG